MYRQKFSVWAWNMWNPCDAIAIILFVVGISLRFRPTTMDVGRVIYCLDSVYWYLRILNILGVNKYLGMYTILFSIRTMMGSWLLSRSCGHMYVLLFVNDSG